MKNRYLLSSLVLIINYSFAQGALAPGWINQGFVEAWDFPGGDTLSTNGSRTVIGGFDLDQDGAGELIFTDYFIYGVRLYEYDAANQVFEQKWRSPSSLAVRGSYAVPRHVGVGDFDNDGQSEIYYSLSHEGDADSLMGGWYYCEWDGVIGSDYYGTTYSSRNQTELTICCDGSAEFFIGNTEYVTNGIDIDGDDRQEHISAVRRSTPAVNRGTLVMSLVGDIYTDNGSAGFETWVEEYYIDISTHIGTYAGSPYQAIPADLDGDGTWEIMNHYWQNFTLFVIDVTGPDTYEIGNSTFGDGWWAATVPNDAVSLFGGAVADVNNDGSDEVCYVVYGDGGLNEDQGDLIVVDYSPGENPLENLQDHVAVVAEDFGAFYGGIYDVDQNGYPNIFGGLNGIKSAECNGGNPLDPSSYTVTTIDDGTDRMPKEFTITDSAGVLDTVVSLGSGVFVSKVQAEFNGNPIDFDNDGNYEIIVSHQGNHAKTTYKYATWNGSGYDTTSTEVQNERNWIVAVYEFGESSVSVQPIQFIHPEDYVLSQNYPNPFNNATTIKFEIPIEKTVSLNIYNEAGQLVKTLINNQNMAGGSHQVSWGGLNNNGQPASSGVYFYTLEWDGNSVSQQMVYLK